MAQARENTDKNRVRIHRKPKSHLPCYIFNAQFLRFQFPPQRPRHPKPQTTVLTETGKPPYKTNSNQ